MRRYRRRSSFRSPLWTLHRHCAHARIGHIRRRKELAGRPVFSSVCGALKSTEGRRCRDVAREEGNDNLRTDTSAVAGDGECRFVRPVNIGRNHSGSDMVCIAAWRSSKTSSRKWPARPMSVSPFARARGPLAFTWSPMRRADRQHLLPICCLFACLACLSTEALMASMVPSAPAHSHMLDSRWLES